MLCILLTASSGVSDTFEVCIKQASVLRALHKIIYNNITTGTCLMGIPSYMGHFVRNGLLPCKCDLLSRMWLQLIGTIGAVQVSLQC